MTLWLGGAGGLNSKCGGENRGTGTPNVELSLGLFSTSQRCQRFVKIVRDGKLSAKLILNILLQSEKSCLLKGLQVFDCAILLIILRLNIVTEFTTVSIWRFMQ
jgi:hypothetical protein